jgi:hypothetical protein
VDVAASAFTFTDWQITANVSAIAVGSGTHNVKWSQRLLNNFLNLVNFLIG